MPSTLTHQLYCPHCKSTPLEVTHYNEIEIDICPRCTGLWCEVGNWDTETLGDFGALRAEPKHIVIDEVPDALALDPTVLDFNVVGTDHLPCPNCKHGMTELEIGQPTIALIDQCGNCGGVWFDHPELHDIEAMRAWSKEHQRMSAELTWGNWWFQMLLQMPIEFNIKPRRFPVVTVSLILINVLIFLAQMTLDESWWIELAAMGREIVAGEDLWAVFTSMFLHGGLLHLFGNMYMLYILGDNVEDVLGRWRYLLFYLVCGIAATVGFAVFNPSSQVPLLGASGAIAGIMAAYLLLFRNSHLTFVFVIFQRKLPVWIWLGGWFIINVLMTVIEFGQTGAGGGVAWIAHVAGFVMGLLIIWPLQSKLVREHSLLRVMRMATA